MWYFAESKTVDPTIVGLFHEIDRFCDETAARH